VGQWSRGWVASGQLVYEEGVKHGFPAERGEIITLGVDLGSFRPFSEEEKKQVQKQLNLQSPVLGFLARLNEEKGCDLLMETLELLNEKRPQWSCYIMGSGPYEKKIKTWAQEKGFADKVRIQLLTHNEVSRVLPAVDILLAPSQTRKHWREQFGRMLVEAFASGVPILGSASGEIPYVLGEAGWVLPEDQSHPWAEAIDSLLDDREKWEGMRKTGLERAQIFSTQACAQKYQKFFSSLI